jgi:hypothetical protein
LDTGPVKVGDDFGQSVLVVTPRSDVPVATAWPTSNVHVPEVETDPEGNLLHIPEATDLTMTANAALIALAPEMAEAVLDWSAVQERPCKLDHNGQGYCGRSIMCDRHGPPYTALQKVANRLRKIGA